MAPFTQEWHTGTRDRLLKCHCSLTVLNKSFKKCEQNPPSWWWGTHCCPQVNLLSEMEPVPLIQECPCDMTHLPQVTQPEFKPIRELCFKGFLCPPHSPIEMSRMYSNQMHGQDPEFSLMLLRVDTEPGEITGSTVQGAWDLIPWRKMCGESSLESVPHADSSTATWPSTVQVWENVWQVPRQKRKAGKLTYPRLSKEVNT